MNIVRSIAAVIGGYMVFALSAVILFHATGRDPHAEQDPMFVALATVYGIGFAALGGFLGGLIAGRRPLTHATCVTILIALGAAISLLSRPGAGAIWSQLSAIVFMAPAALVGGTIKWRHSEKK